MWLAPEEFPGNWGGRSENVGRLDLDTENLINGLNCRQGHFLKIDWRFVIREYFVYENQFLNPGFAFQWQLSVRSRHNSIFQSANHATLIAVRSRIPPQIIGKFRNFSDGLTILGNSDISRMPVNFLRFFQTILTKSSAQHIMILSPRREFMTSAFRWFFREIG
jgi:hypothetical protein